MNKKTLTYLKDCSFFIICEIIVAALTVGVYFAVGFFAEGAIFSYKVVTGAILGAAVMIVNYLALNLYVARVADKVMELRGDREMSEEEIAKFTAENSARIQRTVQLSFVVRSASMVGVLVLAFITKQFDVIATVVPLLAFRPIITVGEMLRKQKCAKAPVVAEREYSAENEEEYSNGSTTEVADESSLDD